jgi:hypothetical protein
VVVIESQIHDAHPPLSQGADELESWVDWLDPWGGFPRRAPADAERIGEERARILMGAKESLQFVLELRLATADVVDKGIAQLRFELERCVESVLESLPLDRHVRPDRV